MGVAFSFETSLVSTCSRVEKKVERSGRRGGWEGEVVVGWGTLCSTVGGMLVRDLGWEGGWKE